MKKIVMSLGLIGAVVAVVIIGGTGAWWTDKATSHNTSFKSGNMDLKLKGYNEWGNGDKEWRDKVGQTWDCANMAPGGEAVGGELQMKNFGTTEADWLKFATTTDPQPAEMNEVMRIASLEYDGESLLEGGAGADLSKYEAPENCDVTLDTLHSKLSNYDEVDDDDVVCVEEKNYSGDFSIDIEGVTLVSLKGPDNTRIDGMISIDADDVTLKGFEVSVGEGNNRAIALKNGDDTTIKNNRVVGSKRAIQGDYYGRPGKVSVINNVFETDYGIAGTEDVDRLLVQGNTFNTNVEGIGIGAGAQDVTIERNEFEGGDYAIKLYDFDDVSYISYNNFLGYEKAVINEKDVWVNAYNNWWDSYNPSEKVEGKIGTDNYLGGPYNGFVNGNDQNDNGFADLEDLHLEDDLIVENPGLEINGENKKALNLEVQMDGPTSTNDHQGGTVGIDMEVTMGQGPVQ